MKIEEIRKKLKDMNVLFVTNTNVGMNSLFPYSLESYSQMLDWNFVLYPANLGKMRLYGLGCFFNMIADQIDKHDYVIYLDDDVFLVPGAEEAFYNIFMKFVESNAVIAGVPDGGVICHRNHNPFMVNTFVSFWNLKEIRVHGITREILTARETTEEINKMSFREYDSRASYKSMFEMKKGMNGWEACIEDSKKARQDREILYAKIVENDPSNPVEPHQVPWSTKYDDFEPYYKLIEWLLLKCDGTIFYLNARDKVGRLENGENSGLSSEIYVRDSDGVVCPVFWHSWFSRQAGNLESPHHKRIMKLVREVRQLKNLAI